MRAFASTFSQKKPKKSEKSFSPPQITRQKKRLPPDRTETGKGIRGFHGWHDSLEVP
jgi:hypothetical protein